MQTVFPGLCHDIAYGTICVNLIMMNDLYGIYSQLVILNEVIKHNLTIIILVLINIKAPVLRTF